MNAKRIMYNVNQYAGNALRATIGITCLVASALVAHGNGQPACPTCNCCSSEDIGSSRWKYSPADKDCGNPTTSEFECFADDFETTITVTLYAIDGMGNETFVEQYPDPGHHYQCYSNDTDCWRS
jgi:hypothetical protein